MSLIYYKFLIVIIFFLDQLFTDSISAGAADLRSFTNNNQQCQMPSYPLHTKYSVIINNMLEMRKREPGEYLPPFSVLLTECDTKYQLAPSSPSTAICINGNWSASLTKCLRSCSPLMSTTSTNVTCKHGKLFLDNCHNPVEGTTATLACNPLYYEPNAKKNPQYFCNSLGKWSGLITPCEPNCGIKRSKANKNLVGGDNAVRGDYPWQVAIYDEQQKFICGGSIIQQNIVLSAAHCFTDSDGNVLPEDNYFLAAGKYYSRYDDRRDSGAQFSKISKIHIPERYNADLSYQANDISILILTTPFNITLEVQLICIELNHEILKLDSSTNMIKGIVTGWGYTEEGSTIISKVLKELEIPFVPREKCFAEVPIEFRNFITSDKICGGYINNSKGVCKGDSGGALVFKGTQDQYYVKGIVSTSPATSELQCDSNQYSTYTSVNEHIEFINEILTKNQMIEFLEFSQEDEVIDFHISTKISTKSCQLPNFPRNGKLTIVNQTNAYKPGENVPQDSVLVLTCDTTYISDLEPLNEFTCLNTGEWKPPLARCTRTCPPLISSPTTKVKCKYNGKPTENCQHPKEGTIAILTCNTFYEEPSLLTNPNRLCTEGRWNSPIPQCYPKCGTPTETYKTSMWNVGIYDKNKEFLCGGSIINMKMILSAAQCFTDYNSIRLPAENYLVAAGKYFRAYLDDRDKDAQYSKVLEIHIPETYLGRINYNSVDIALLILREPFSLSNVVQPVCLDKHTSSKNLDISTYNNGSGQITGWGYIKETWVSSDVLHVTKVTYIPPTRCFQKLPRSFRYFTYDKICGEHTTDTDEIPVCGGDCGGGLVFYNLDDEKYYLKGVVSLAPLTEEHQCDLEKYGVYTSVDVFYENYLKEVIANHI